MLQYHMGWADVNATFYGTLQKVDEYLYNTFFVVVFVFFLITVTQNMVDRYLVFTET